MKKTVMAVGGAIAVLATATVVKLCFAPAIKDSYFEPDAGKLQLVPAGIVVVRPSRFPHSAEKIRHVHDGDSLARTVGRNTTLRDLVAEAYDWDPGRVVVPPEARKDDFDFLVTASNHTRKHLQAAIRNTLGYDVRRETRETAVLILRATNPGLPGLAVSAQVEAEAASYSNGMLHFKHEPLSVIKKGLEAGLALPVIDQTGLTNCYDFSVVWNAGIQSRMQEGAFGLDGVKAVLKGWGLALEPDTQVMDLLVVEKTR